MPENSRTTSRRNMILTTVASAAGISLGLLAPPASARGQVKLSQADSGYQGGPRSGQRCDQCANWLPPASCKFVAGPLSANGWCSLFAPRH